MPEKKKMLVIEEELVLRKLIAYDLDMMVDASFASNWVEAVRLLREDKFDLVLIDFSLGGMPEYCDVFRFIHAIDLDYRVLPIFPNEEDLYNARDVLMRSGVEFALSASWSKEEFIECVMNCFEG